MDNYESNIPKAKKTLIKVLIKALRRQVSL